MPYLYIRCYDENFQMISQVWSGTVSLTANVTSSVLASTWSGWDLGTSVSDMNDVFRSYFSSWSIPSINPGKGLTWSSADIDRNTMMTTWLRGSEIVADLSYATWIGVVDADDNGFYFGAQPYYCFKIGEDRLYTTTVGGIEQPILRSGWTTATTTRMAVALPFLTTDGKAGFLSLRFNKNNSYLTWWSDANSERILAWYNGIPVGPSDPYQPGGVSGHEGGTGDWRVIDDPIDFPELPTISAADAGFISIWVPTLYQLQDLSNFMWNADPTKISFWKNMIANPIDLILSLCLFPFEIDVETDPAYVTLGLIDSKILMYYTDQQFHEIDCGELDLSEYYGAFLDYAPYTSVEIYLPYIGIRTLNINDCMPKTIHVKYVVDIATGSCIALIKCGSSVYYHFPGSCSTQVPITSGQAQQLAQQAISAAASVIKGAMSGGGAGALAAAIGSSAAAVQSGMPAPERSGNLAGNTGFMDNQQPYLIITRPRQAIPEAQNDLTGYPSFITKQMSELSGYTEIQVTHLHNMTATQPEIDEIVQLLKGGVFF